MIENALSGLLTQEGIKHLTINGLGAAKWNVDITEHPLDMSGGWRE